VTALAVPTTSATLVCATTAGLVCQSATTGGTWPNSAEFVGYIYVDALGGWSVASTTASLTPSASGTNVLQFNSPAASTGAVGWLPFGGLAYNTTTYVLPVTATNCTLSTAFTGYPVCAIGANATMTAPVVTTSLIPQSGGIAAAYNPNPQSHTTFAYRPSQRPGYQFQTNYGPFVACPAVTAGQLCVVGTIQLPTGFLQALGIGRTTGKDCRTGRRTPRGRINWYWAKDRRTSRLGDWRRRATLALMLTGEIRNQIDRIWDAFWSGGISNPLEVIEQITYLLSEAFGRAGNR